MPIEAGLTFVDAGSKSFERRAISSSDPGFSGERKKLAGS